MSKIKALPSLEALEQFRQAYPAVSLDDILAMSESVFVAQYADAFGGDTRKARSAYREAQHIRALVTLLWANIKDTVGSAHYQETLFNNIPQSFLDFQGLIPSYPQLFGNLDFIECDHARSIFGPAAYFVDLLRFIEKYIPQDSLTLGHRLEDRQPRIYRVPLDKENTYTLIPYIDLVNEVLEDVVRTSQTPDAYQVVAESVFPMSLPFHLPLAQMRLYLDQLKLSLQEIYRLFGRTEPAIAREILTLSPADYARLGGPIVDKAQLDAFYGMDTTSTGHGSIRDAAVFEEQTGFSRTELDTLLQLDLSADELEVGLGRLSFIQAAGDDHGPIQTVNDVQDTLFTDNSDLAGMKVTLNQRELPGALEAKFTAAGVADFSENTRVLVDRADRQWRVWDGDSDRTYVLQASATTLTAYSQAYDRLDNLTLVKLDRIYRFSKLSRRLDWSFADLDWALRSLADQALAQQSLGPAYVAQSVLQFDGINDWVQIPDADDIELAVAPAVPQMTLEAWVFVDAEGVNPILAKGSTTGPLTQFQLWVTQAGQVAFQAYGLEMEQLVSVFAMDASGNYFTADADGGNPDPDADGSAPGFSLISHGQLDTGRFNHVAVTVNKQVTEDSESYFQLEFYLNGKLDSMWSFSSALPIQQAPAADASVEIRLGTNFEDDYLVGSLSDVRLWSTIRSQADIERSLSSRLRGPTIGLLGYWPLSPSDGDRLPDLAPGTQHAGIPGGTTYTTLPRWIQRDLPLLPLPTPISDTALHFNGLDDFLATSGVAGLDVNELTLEAWVKLDADDREHALIVKGDAASGAAHFDWRITASNEMALDGSILLGAAQTSEVLSLSTDRTHLAVVVTSDQVRFYVDGELAGERASTVGTAAIGADLLLGRNLAGGALLKGTLQEVRIWRVARTMDELRRTLDQQLNGSEAGLIGYWRLDSDALVDGRTPDLSFSQNGLYPGGDPGLYQPELQTHQEVLLPTPAARPAWVLSSDPSHYALRVVNPEDHGLGHYEQFTLQLWFRVEDPHVAERKQVVLSQGDVDNGLCIYLSADGLLRAHAWCYSVDGDRIDEHTLSTTAIEKDTWYQLSFVYDETVDGGVSYRFYLDGGADEAALGFRLDQVGPIHLGGLTPDAFTRFHDADAFGSAHRLGGAVTDLRLWKKALPGSAITQPADARHPRHIPQADDPDLLCYLPMTEGYGAPVGEHEGPRYAPDSDDPTLLTPIIRDQTSLSSGPANGQPNDGHLVVGDDPVARKWSTEPRLAIHPRRALHFDGGHVRMSDTAELGLVGSSFTIEVWVQAGSFDSAMTLIDGGSALALTLTDGGAVEVTLGSATLRGGVLEAGRWHHLAWRFDSAQARQSLLIDGELAAEGAASVGIVAGFQPRIGDGFDGSISDLRLWDVARSDEQLAAHRELRLTGAEANLVGYWPLDVDPARCFIDRANGQVAVLEANGGELAATPFVELQTPFARQEIHLGINGAESRAELIDLVETVLPATGTVELWARFDRGDDQTLLDASTPTHAFRLVTRGSALVFELTNASGQASSVSVNLADLPSNFDGQVHHIATSWDFGARATQAQLHLDDLVVRAAPTSSGGVPALARPRLGLSQADDQPFTGVVHRLRLWDHVRSAALLRSHADADLGGPNNGLLLLMRLDEQAGNQLSEVVSGREVWAKALSTEQSDPTWTIVDHAVVLDGDGQYIDASGFTPGTEGTIELWVKFSRNRDQVLFDASNGELDDGSHGQGEHGHDHDHHKHHQEDGHEGEDGHGEHRDLRKFFALQVRDGALSFRLEDDGGQLEQAGKGKGKRAEDKVAPGDADYEARISLTGNDFVDFDRQWHHVVASWSYDADSNTVTGDLRLDLEHRAPLQRDADSGSEPSGALPSLKPLFIGANTGTYGRVAGDAFDGQLRQARIWNQLRTEADLRALRDRPLAGDETDLAVYLAIDEGSGTQLANGADDDAPSMVIPGDEQTATWRVVDRAVQLNGGDSIDQFIAVPEPLPGTAGTIEFFARFAVDRDQILLDASDSDDRPFFVFDLASSRLRFRLAGDTAGAELDLSDAVTTPTIWHHIVATWRFDTDAQSAELEVYFDDRPAARATLTDVLPREDLRNPYIGMRRGEANTLPEYGAFEGELRQIRLWSLVRDAAELDRYRRIELDGNETGLVAHLLIDEAQGATLGDSSDERAGARLMTRVLAEAQWGRRPGQLWQFGPSYAVLPTTDALGLVDGEFTVESWVRLPDVGAEHPLIGTRGPAEAGSNEVWSLGVVDGHPRARMQGQTLDATDLSLVADTWHHLAVRYQSGSLTLWLDGSLSAQSLDALAPLQASRRLHVGHLRTCAGEGVWNDSSFAGSVDELRVWGVALADETLQAPQTTRIASDSLDLAALWRFDDRQRHALLDHSARQLHPVLVVDEAASKRADFAVSGPPILLHPNVLGMDDYNDYLDLGEPWVRADGAWSVVFWFRLEHADGVHVLFEQAKTVRVSVEDGCFQVEAPFTDGGVWEEAFMAQVGVWTHVAVVHEAGQLRVIRDGVAIEQTRATGFAADQSAGALRFGGPLDLSTSTDTHMAGQLAEVELWARALDASEVSASSGHPLSGREAGLEAYWPLSEGAGTSSSDVCEFWPDGALITGLEDARDKWRPDAPPITVALSALVLDGRDDHVSLGSLSDLLAKAVSAGGLCVEAWVKHPGGPGRSAVLGSSAGDGSAGLCLGLDDGRPIFALGAQIVQAETALDAGWHHLAWTHDGTTATIVLNGAKLAEGALSLTLPGADASAWLGRHQDWDAEADGAVDRYLGGALGEVRLWSSARSVAAIASDRGQRLIGNEPELSAYWIFDDRHVLAIPSKLGVGNYQLILASDRVLQPPLWAQVDDHPVVLEHLSRQALAFDGEQQYLGLEGFTSRPKSFTVEAWVMNTQSASETRPRQDSPVLWRGREKASGFAIDFELRVMSSGKLAFLYRPGGGAVETLETDSSFAVNRLTHVAVTVTRADQTTICLYIDGAKEAETTEASALRNSGSMLRAGWGNASGSVEHFRGLIQELRIWSEARTDAELEAARFIPLAAVDHPKLLGRWPLASVSTEAGTTPNSARPELPFVLGGVAGDRSPDVLALVDHPTPFLDPSERVLSLEQVIPAQLPIPPFDDAEQPHRKQRTIEAWFCCERINAAGRQVIYQEGDEQRGLSISVENGVLTFSGRNRPDDESAWQGTTIITDKIGAGRWHHAALVLDGRGDVQDNSFSAAIDGRLIDVLPGSQVWGTVAPIVIGGLRFEQPVSITRIAASDERVQRSGSWHVTRDGLVHDRNKNKGDKSLEWTFEQSDGLYRLGLSHPVDDPLAPKHASKLAVRIDHAGGTDVVTIDLRRAGGPDPVDLGEYQMVENTSKVTLSNADTDGLVIVDALQLTPLHYRDPATPPTPVSTAVSLDPSERLYGQIKEVRVWERVRQTDELIATRFDISGIDDALRSDLLFHWQTSALAEAATAPLRLPASVQAFGGVPSTIDLVGLGMLRELASATDLPIERACVLFAGLRYFGNGDESTLFDGLFNRAGTSDDDRWSYYPSAPRIWVLGSTLDEHRAMRSRLMGAFRVSHDDLDRMAAAVAGVDSAAQLYSLDLDGPTLTLLYRLRLLATVLGLSITDVVTLMKRLRAEVGLAELDSLSLGDIETLRERAAWHQASAIDVPEYEYLVYDQRDRRVEAPYDDGSVVDGATDLTASVLGVLITPASFVSADVNEAASDAVYRQLLAAAHLQEISLLLPGDEASVPVTLAVVLSSFLSYTDTSTIAQSMDWAADFRGQVIAFDELVAGDLIDAEGRVTAVDSSAALRALVTSKAEGSVDPTASLRTLAVAANLDPEQCVLLRDLLGKRRVSQDSIPEVITATLQGSRDEVESSMFTTLASLLGSTSERVQAIVAHTEGQTYKEGALIATLFLTETNAIAAQRTPSASAAVQGDLDQLNKTLFLLAQFKLSREETEALLQDPATFGLQPSSLLTPTLSDLERLHDFVQLKSTLNDPGNRVLELIQVTSEPEAAIEDLTQWLPGEIQTLAAALGITDRAKYTDIASLTELQRGFAVTDKLGSDAAYLIDLSATEDRDFATHQRQSDALLELLRARYSEDQWPRVFEPIHDMLAEQQRDSLVAVTLEKLADQLSGRKSADVLYEYLLIDVSTQSVVDTSRILQATAAMQLYVQRCRMSLEKDVDPGVIPADEWLWMKNYRVWEANRKVFLYPENYIEPELRDTKTPLFEELEDELNQVAVDKDTAAVAYTHYLDSFAEVTNLTIVGSYLDTDSIPADNMVAAPEFTGGNSRSVIREVEGSDVGALLPNNLTVEMWVNHQHAGDAGSLVSAFTPESRTLSIDTNPLSGRYNNYQKRWLIAWGRYRSSDFDPQYQDYTIESKRGWGIGVNSGQFEIFLTTHEIGTGDIDVNSSPTTIHEYTVMRSALAGGYPEGRWFHVAVTYDESTLRLFVDGDEVNLVPVVGSNNISKTRYPQGSIRYQGSATPLTLASEGSGSFFNGQVRELRLWNAVRNASAIRSTMLDGVAGEADELPASLVRYWLLNEGLGPIVQDRKAGNNFEFPTDDVSDGYVAWIETSNTATQQSGDNATVRTTLYLVGRNDATQEYYLRSLIDDIEWTPWEKIDLSISAEFVAPVFAFNKLYLFWAEIQDSVTAENRRWVKRSYNRVPEDQLGETIMLTDSEPSGAINPSSFSASVRSTIIDNLDGGYINSRNKVYSDKNGIIEKVNITVQKPVIKYSYHNFSDEWTQPQDYVTLDDELDEAQQRQPKWRRVYAQRWRESSVAPRFQPTPTTQSDVTVARLIENSYVETQLSSFAMDELTLSYWFRVEDLVDGQRQFQDQPATSTFTLFDYDDGALRAQLSHQPTQIGQSVEILAATQTGRDALLDSDSTVGVTGAVGDLVGFRLATPSPSSLSAAIAALDVDDSTTLIALANQAAAAITEDDDEPRTLLSQALAQHAVKSAAAASAALSLQATGSPNAIELSDELATAAEETKDAASAAQVISGQDETVLDNVNSAAESARAGATAIEAAAESAAQTATTSAGTATSAATTASVAATTAALKTAPDDHTTAAAAVVTQTNVAATKASLAASKTQAAADATTVGAAQTAATEAETAATDAETAATAAETQQATFPDDDSVPAEYTTASQQARAAATAARTAATDARARADALSASSSIDSVIGHLQSTLTNALPVLNAAVSAEDEQPRYAHGDIELSLAMGASGSVLLDPVAYGVWYHLTLVLDSGDSETTVTSYLVQQSGTNTTSVQTITQAPITLASGRVTAAETLSVGNPGNPAGTTYLPWMSEFQLWDRPLGAATIAAERYKRKLGSEVGLQLHLPLDTQASTTSALDLVDDDSSGLSLDTISAAESSTSTVERILLMYGENLYSLRSNLKDVGNTYTLLSNAYTARHDLSIVRGASTTFIGQDSSSTNVVVEAHRDANALYPLDRYRPVDRIAVLADTPDALEGAVDEWDANINNKELLADQSTDARLDDNESYIMDVHNQPGAYILDIGDEIFLVRIKLGEQRLRTAEERLRSDLVSGTDYELYYERERTLEVNSGLAPVYSFTRLNTFAAQELSERLFGGGIDGLLNLASQEDGTEKPFTNLALANNTSVESPELGMPAGVAPNAIDFNGAYGPYYSEVFFHIPFLIANQLSSNQQFEDAQSWYHYIFDPTAQESSSGGTPSTRADRFWRYRPFRHLTLETLSELLTNEGAIERYRRDPFDPHAIAALRINAYQKAVVMKYIANLMDWADYLFSQDTRESINEALPLYVLAFNLLGERPRARQTHAFEPAGDLRDVQADIARSPDDFPNDAAGNEITDFLFELDAGLSSERRLQVPFDPRITVATRFCVPENAQFIGFWDRVEDRLFKIRNSLNIDGVFRALALFQPPIDPAALVSAVSGSGLAGALGGGAAAGATYVPHYRFYFMREQAKTMAGNVISLGGALLDALEKKDAETLAVLQQGHAIGLLQLTTTIKKLQIDETELNKAALQISWDTANQRRSTYQTRIDNGLSTLEEAQIGLMITSGVLRGIATGLNIVSSVTSAIPDIEVGGSGFGGSPVATVKAGGSNVSNVTARFATALNGVAAASDTAASIVSLYAGYERRKSGWKLERNQAQLEMDNITKQLEAIDVTISSQTQDLRIHEQSIAQEQEVADFLQDKFTNADLYNWMSSRITSLYFQSYKLAFDLAKEAEAAYQFEYGLSDTYISYGHWDSRKKGLLAGEALLLDINRLEKQVLDQDSHFLEVFKPISLARLDPMAFLDLKTTGRCQFSLGELLFDRDFPGHYFRVIKSVSISVPAVVGPYQTIKATLTQTGHKTLLAPDLSGVDYLLGESDTMPGSIRADWRANQQVTLSTGVDDCGLFQLDFNDDRYLPFEGTGAVSTWLLEMPLSTNAIDFDSISDVVINLRYLCKTDGGKFKQDVANHSVVRTVSGRRLFSVASEFAAQWHAFNSANLDVSTLALTLPANAFPPNVVVDMDTLTLDTILGVDEAGALVDVNNAFTDRSGQDVPPMAPDVDSASPRFTLEARNNFDKSSVENLLVLVTYSGQLRSDG